MKATSAFRAGLSAAGILAVTVGLSGCMGSPTYGTDRTAMEQLGDDLGNTIALGSDRDEKNRKLRYQPRPSLVVAKTDESGNQPLPAPQQSLASRENNPNWVESPEETRERLRNEAKDNSNNQNYRSPLLNGRGEAGTMSETEKWEAFRKAKADVETVDMNARRRSLADPPTVYRAADAGTLTDMGEPESKKEARRRKEAADASKSSSWWNPFQ